MARAPHPFSAPFSPAEARRRVQNAILLAGATMIFAFPTYWYQYSAAAGRIFSLAPTGSQLQMIALGQSIIIFGAALLCSMVGFMYSDRLSLPGLGSWRSVPAWVAVGLAAGLVAAYPSWWLSDRVLLAGAPELEPSPWPISLARMMGIALTQEVIGRFGLLTIAIYLLKRLELSTSIRPAILAVSAFGAFGSMLLVRRLGLDVGGVQLTIAVAFSFAANWVFCETYVRRGLLPAICLHAGLNIKLLIYSFIM